MTPLADAWPELVCQMRAREACVVATDFDGTLVDLADCPGDVVMSPRARATLGRLASRSRVTVALASGRRLRELDALVGLPEAILVGNHGFEVRVPGRAAVYEQITGETRVSRMVLFGLQREASRVPGLWIEDKGPILTVHLRHVAPNDVPAAHAIVHDIVSPYRSCCQALQGRQVIEIRPCRPVTKGSALCGALRQHGVAPDAFCWYFGDDVADEDVFTSLPSGSATVRVGSHRPTSAARFVVNEPATVLDVLDALDEVAASMRRSETQSDSFHLA